MESNPPSRNNALPREFSEEELTRFVRLSRAAYRREDDRLRSDYDRSLPFADAVLANRWDRAERLGFSPGAGLYDSALVFGDVTVGASTWIGPGVVLDGSGGPLRIGAFCSIAAGVHIYTHDTVLWALSGGAAPPQRAPVSIGDCCYIGPQSVVRAGVVIGRQCVVGANSFVKDPLPDRTVAAGSPARIIGRVTGEGVDARVTIDAGVGKDRSSG